jgi:hypothetical protein
VAREIVVALDDGTVRAFDAQSGEALWSTAAECPVSEAPLPLWPGRALVVCPSGELHAVGEELARSSFLLPVGEHPTRPVLDRFARRQRRRVVLVGSRDGRLRSLRCRVRRGELRCRPRWSVRTGAWITAPPLITNRRIFLGSFDTGVYALARSNGHLRWKTLASHRLDLPPVRMGERLVVAPRTSGGLQVFRLADGAPGGHYQGEEGLDILAPPAIIKDRLALLVTRPGAGSVADPPSPLYMLRSLVVREKPDEDPDEGTASDEGGDAPAETLSER